MTRNNATLCLGLFLVAVLVTFGAAETKGSCYWQSYWQGVADYFAIPEDSVEAVAMRFSVSGPESLMTIRAAVYDAGDGTFGNDTIFISVYDNDGAGLPGAMLFQEAIAPGDYPAYPDWLTLDVSGANLVMNGDFHVVYATSADTSSGESESILSDDGQIDARRSTVSCGGTWNKVVDHFGSDANLLMEVYMCRAYDTCYTNADVDGNGVALTISDMVYLVNFVYAGGPPPYPLYMGDINGDCYVDHLDVQVYECYIAQGMSCFPLYPVPTCCDPDTVRGACCYYDPDTCHILTPANCDVSGGVYAGDGVSCSPDPCKIACDCEPGNANGDATLNILDITYLISYIYMGGSAPTPYELCSGDANCNCIVNILDITYLIAHIYAAGPSPCTCENWLDACGPPLRR